MNIPALSQSSTEQMACPRSYVAIEIEGKRTGNSIESERGNEVHDVVSKYINHCVVKQVKADWPAFDRIAKAVGPVAGPILRNFRDSFEVPFDRVYATEIALALTEDFKPCHDEYARGKTETIPTVVYDDGQAAHHGKLDVLLLSPDGMSASILDFKSHPQPFDPDTYQSKLYPEMVFKHFPSVQSVKFVLIFVRYQNNFREVNYTRRDIPELEETLRQARERQRGLHENSEDAPALPCKACTYCPLAKDLSCPIADWNEYTVMSPGDRLRALEFYARMTKLHRPVMKAFVEVHGAGSVSYKDGAGNTYSYAPMETPSTTIPLDDTTISVLRDHAQATGENLLTGRLHIKSSDLKPLLKAKKRATLASIFEDSIFQTETKPKWKVERSDVDQDLDEFEREQEEEDGYYAG